ncbi:MAG: tetratricopeptide repeat protein [Gemmataceae bacterium]
MKDKWYPVRVIVMLALVGGLGYLAYRWYFHSSTETLLQQGEESYAAGLAALDQEKFDDALTRLDEAVLRANQGLANLEQTLKETKNTDQKDIERYRALEGKFLWLKARGMREAAYAKLGADGKAVLPVLDSSTGEKIRVYYVITGDKRAEAIGCLLEAATRLNEPTSLFVEVLRNELFLPTPNWQLLADMSEKILAKDDKDARCHYLLARYDFEQPRPDKRSTPAPEEKRSRDRVLNARTHLAKVEATKDYPLWRTLHLKAKIDAWLARRYAEGKNVELAAQEEKTLRTLLAEAAEHAKAGDGLKNMSGWDIDGLLDLTVMGVSVTLDDLKKEGEVDAKRLLAAVDQALTTCESLVEKKGLPLDRVAQTAIRTMMLTQPFLAKTREADWKTRLARVKTMARNALESKAGSAELFTKFGELLSRESHVEAQRNNLKEAEKLRAELGDYLDRGLKAAEEAKGDPLQIADLHLLAANHALVNHAKREVIEAHLKAVAATKDPQRAMTAHLIECVLDERDGRLTSARKHLEQVLASPYGELVLRAHMVGVGIYLALGEPAEALGSLRILEKVYQTFDDLSDQEKAWALEFLRSPHDLAYLQIVANLETAKNAALDYARKHPGKTVPAAVVDNHEREVARLLKELPAPPNPLPREARLALVRYLLAMNREGVAAEQFAKVKKDYPDHVSTLQTEVGLVLREARAARKDDKGDPLDAKVVARVDGMIEGFIKSHPDDQGARSFWASWLVQSKRADKAIAYLDDPLNFPDAKADGPRRILAMALLGKGEVEEARKVLRHLDNDPNVTALLVQLATNPEERDKELGAAIGKFENAGLFRCWKASLMLQGGKAEEACREYFNALDFSRVTALARSGLQGALFALARTDPEKARALSLEFLKAQPQERGLYLTYAYASVLLDDIGAQDDLWEKQKNMASALNVWETMASEAKESSTNILLTRAEFWSLAGRDDLARPLVERAAAADSADPRPIRMLIALEMVAPGAESRALAEKQVERLAKLEPASADPGLLRASLAEQAGKGPEALVLLVNLADKFGKDARVYRGIVRLLEKEKDKTAAREWADKWLKQLPNDVEAAATVVALLAGDKKIDEARTFAEDYVRKQAEAARERLTKGRKGEKSKDSEKTLDDLDNALRVDLARGLIRGRAYDEAEKWLEAALKRRPDDVAILMLQGECLLGRENWKGARAHYEAILRKTPNQFVVTNNLSWLLAAKLGEPERALALARVFRLGLHSKKILPGNRLNASFLDTLGVIYTALNRKDLYPEMRDLFEPAVRRYPADPRMYLYLGHAYRGLNEAARAQAMYAAAIARVRADGSDSATNQEVLREAEAAQKRLKEAGSS